MCRQSGLVGEVHAVLEVDAAEPGAAPEELARGVRQVRAERQAHLRLQLPGEDGRSAVCLAISDFL